MFDWLVTIWLRLPRTLRGNLRVGGSFWEGCRGPFVAILRIYLRVGAHFGKAAAGRLWQLHVFVQFIHSPVTIWLKLPRALRGNFRFGGHFG